VQSSLTAQLRSNSEAVIVAITEVPDAPLEDVAPLEEVTPLDVDAPVPLLDVVDPPINGPPPPVHPTRRPANTIARTSKCTIGIDRI
jgi:hypothetical protein